MAPQVAQALDPRQASGAKGVLHALTSGVLVVGLRCLIVAPNTSAANSGHIPVAIAGDQGSAKALTSQPSPTCRGFRPGSPKPLDGVDHGRTAVAKMPYGIYAITTKMGLGNLKAAPMGQTLA